MSPRPLGWISPTAETSRGLTGRVDHSGDRVESAAERGTPFGLALTAAPLSVFRNSRRSFPRISYNNLQPGGALLRDQAGSLFPCHSEVSAWGWPLYWAVDEPWKDRPEKIDIPAELRPMRLVADIVFCTLLVFYVHGLSVLYRLPQQNSAADGGCSPFASHGLRRRPAVTSIAVLLAGSPRLRTSTLGESRGVRSSATPRSSDRLASL